MRAAIDHREVLDLKPLCHALRNMRVWEPFDGSKPNPTVSARCEEGCFGFVTLPFGCSNEYRTYIFLRFLMSASYAINMPSVAAQTAPSRAYPPRHC